MMHTEHNVIGTNKFKAGAEKLEFDKLLVESGNEEPSVSGMATAMPTSYPSEETSTSGLQ